MAATKPTPAMALLLADARLPSGAHVHSGGMEQAVDDGIVFDVADLERFAAGRLLTTGRLAAHAAALACTLAGGTRTYEQPRWQALDDEVSARIASPALRATSRKQGRLLLRTGASIWPDAPLTAALEASTDGTHLCVAQGVVAQAAGLGPREAALVSAYGTVTTVVSAALRLLGLDPLSATAVLARLAATIDRVADDALAAAHGPPRDLPAPAAPRSDYLGERHAARTERLFAS